jgi:hypothetical protein
LIEREVNRIIKEKVRLTERRISRRRAGRGKIITRRMETTPAAR